MSGNTWVVRRPDRRRPPEQPSGEVLLEPPPEIPETVTGGGLTQILTYLPMIAGAGAMALMFTGGGTGNPIMMVASGLFAVSMVGMTIGQIGQRAPASASNAQRPAPRLLPLPLAGPQQVRKRAPSSSARR